MHFVIVSAFRKQIALFVCGEGTTPALSKADLFLEQEAQGVARSIPGSVIFPVAAVRKNTISATPKGTLVRLPTGKHANKVDSYILALEDNAPIVKWLGSRGKFTRKLIRSARHTWEQAIAIQLQCIERGLPAVSVYALSLVEGATKTEDCLESATALRMIAAGKSLPKKHDLATYALPNSYTTPASVPAAVRKTLAHTPEPNPNRDQLWWSQHQCAPERAHLLDDQQYITQNRLLIKKILDFGGGEVQMPTIEDDLDKLLKRGLLVIPKTPLLKPGAPSQCHFNAARLWENNKSSVAIMTGYALDASAIWVPHSWGVHLDSGRIIETTSRRQAYFGFMLSTEESEQFSFDNE